MVAQRKIFPFSWCRCLKSQSDGFNPIEQQFGILTVLSWFFQSLYALGLLHLCLLCLHESADDSLICAAKNAIKILAQREPGTDLCRRDLDDNTPWSLAVIEIGKCPSHQPINQQQNTVASAGNRSVMQVRFEFMIPASRALQMFSCIHW